ncbi:hypothetical protein QBC38DRAFT_151710 [Podospora fimiseda]|uniref:Transmembrane protein n=1 Tax=Podospora fimiseda TaxID=252190 RepID=A0AAN7BS60_9PEZI|nr:hypothetical protein QBC38DRAFT_151710 [Podospora fimiseda]
MDWLGILINFLIFYSLFWWLVRLVCKSPPSRWDIAESLREKIRRGGGGVVDEGEREREREMNSVLQISWVCLEFLVSCRWMVAEESQSLVMNTENLETETIEENTAAWQVIHWRGILETCNDSSNFRDVVLPYYQGSDIFEHIHMAPMNF